MSGLDSSPSSDSPNDTSDDRNDSVNDTTQDGKTEPSDAKDNSLESQTETTPQGEIDAANGLEGQNPTEQTKEQEKSNAQPSEVPTQGQETQQNQPTEAQTKDLGDLSPRGVAENAYRESTPQSMEQENAQKVENSITNPPSKAEGFGSQAQDKLNEIADKVSDKVFGNAPEVVKESVIATGRQNIEAGYQAASDNIKGNERNTENLPQTFGVTIKGKTQ